MAGEDWQFLTLDDCVTFGSGGTPSKSCADFWSGTIPWVSAKDLKVFRLHDAEDHVTAEAIDAGSRLAPAGSIFLLVRGMTLHNDVPICVAMRDMAFNQDIKALMPKPGVDGSFLTYWLLSQKPALLSSVDSAGHGTGRLNTDTLKAMSVPLPPLAEQRAIAAVLGALDDKIDLNRRMNATLEAMARALFQSWFVEFDPVRAKLDGRSPFRLDPGTADLFPAAFQESALGPIPKGWEVGRLDDALTLQRGFDLPASDRTPGKYPVMAASGPNGCHEKSMVRGPGVTTGRSGVLGRVFFVHGDFWPLNTSLWVKDFKKVSPAYAYHLLRGLDFDIFNAGSAVPTLNRNHVHNLPVVIPPKSIVEAFDAKVMPLMKLENANEGQTGALAAVRDALLPKLLSGELRPHRH